MHSATVLTSNEMPCFWIIPAVLQGTGGLWDGLNVIQQCSLSAAQPNEAAAAAAAAQQLLQGGTVPFSGLTRPHLHSPVLFGVSPYNTPICPSESKGRQVQVRAEGTFSPGKRQVRSTVIAAYNCTELDSHSQQKNKSLWCQGKF